jgi:predicted ATP-binding protein involved in virulence
MIKTFKINGLYRKYDFKLQFEDNTLILVGENGTHKSKLLNLFYHAIRKTMDDALFLLNDNKYSLLNEKEQRIECKFNHLYVVDGVIVNNTIDDKKLYTDEDLENFNQVWKKYRPHHNITVNYYGVVDVRTDNEKDGIITLELSKGELYLLDVLSTLYLHAEPRFVIIDNPETYLSVEWQETFLEDVKNAPYCNGLLVATHSPFIFDNTIRKYAHGVGRFMTTL